MIFKIMDALKKIMPNVQIIAGGPEASFDAENILKHGVDVVVHGEGEESFRQIINGVKFSNIEGISYKQGDKIISNAQRMSIELERLPFCYNHETWKSLDNKIIYYEASRGCPFQCSYCLSSVEERGSCVRFLPLERVYKDLTEFLDAKVKQVKFVDRTFNCNKEFATGIWKFIIKNDNGATNFHFEISADLLGNDEINLLSEARRGLIQFEIGVQSINLQTLKHVNRRNKLDKITKNVKAIEALKNIHQHLDLIVGLPGEGYESFKNSFNYVYALRPQQLQIGFLKLLKGSPLRDEADKFGIVYKSQAPYEVLFTDDLSFYELTIIKEIEEIFEIYYNSGLFMHSLNYCISLFSDAFSFYKAFRDYYEKENLFGQLHSKFKNFEIYIEFCKTNFDLNENIELIQNLLKFDMLLNENIKNNPQWFPSMLSITEKECMKHFYRNKENRQKYFTDYLNYEAKQLGRMYRIDKFEYEIVKLIESDYKIILRNNIYILFKEHGEYWKVDIN